MIPAASVVGRDDAVLIVIDPQERLAAAMEDRQAVRRAIVRLVKVAGIVAMPVIATRQYPKGLGELEAEIEQALAEAAVEGSRVDRCDKLAFDCFAESCFAETVGSTGRRQLVICGMETHICVAQTALDALRQGYDVHVVADAACSRREVDHVAALERLRNAGAVVTTHESVMYELIPLAGTDEFRRLLALVKG